MSWSVWVRPGMLYMKATPAAVIGMKSKGNVGGVVPTLESTYPVSLTA